MSTKIHAFEKKHNVGTEKFCQNRKVLSEPKSFVGTEKFCRNRKVLSEPKSFVGKNFSALQPVTKTNTHKKKKHFSQVRKLHSCKRLCSYIYIQNKQMPSKHYHTMQHVKNNAQPKQIQCLLCYSYIRHCIPFVVKRQEKRMNFGPHYKIKCVKPPKLYTYW